MLNINILSKSFSEKKILSDIKIDIKKNEFISIIGPSGCGKTTFLNILSGLDKEFKGEIEIFCKNISYMFQDNRLLPWLTVKENLLLVSKSKDLEEVKELLKIIGLEETLNEYPKALSGGMKKRISLIRAFINQPELIFLDEPFTSLDFPTSQELKQEFLMLCKRFNPTVLLVTHDISEAILLSHKILFFSKKPSSIIYEFNNPNNQEFDIKKIDKIKNQLFDLYPNILKGEL